MPLTGDSPGIADRPTVWRVVDPIFAERRLAEVYDPLDPDRSDLDAYASMVDGRIHDTDAWPPSVSLAISATNERVSETVAAPSCLSGSHCRWRQPSARRMRSAHCGNSCSAHAAAARFERRSPNLIALSPRHIVR